MANEVPKSLDFHYIKSNSFRVVHCDGVWGGTTPRGYITMSFYSERSPIPQKLTHALQPSGQLADETDRDSKAGIVREVDVEVVVDLKMAKSLTEWLQGHIEFLEQQQNQRGTH